MSEPHDELLALRRRVERERKARLEAEAIAERITRELYAKAELMGLLQRVAVAANEAQTADEALRAAVTHLCKSTGWPVGHVYKPVLDGSGVLLASDIWYLEDPARFEAFRAKTMETVLPPGIGLPGRLAQSGHPAWVPDVTVDPNFPRAEAAAAIGIRAGGRRVLRNLRERAERRVPRRDGPDRQPVRARGGARARRPDAGQFEQVIMNLIVNARDAMPRGGRLTIETALVELDEQYARDHVGVQPGTHVMLAVSDTGIGMDAATRERIFEPFFTTKPEGPGTGLGLATVFGIVAQSGGSIWVYSEVEQGTTFKVYLPPVALAPGASPPAAATAAPAATARPRGTETILLVEDDDGVRFVGEDVLKRLGYTVLSARNGEEALRLSAAHDGPIAILVSDIVMPGMAGPEFRAQLSPQRPDMKVLFLSGYAAGTAVHHGILGPDAAFLEKPFGPEALARKIRAVIDGLGCDARRYRRFISQTSSPSGRSATQPTASSSARRAASSASRRRPRGGA